MVATSRRSLSAVISYSPSVMCGCIWSALTFDMRGGRQLAKPDVGRPLDGRVRRHCRDAPCLMAARMAKAALRLALVADPSYFSWADWRNSMALASACL